MRAVGFWEFGGPDVLEEIELPDPHPEPGQVRIRVRAATVNPTDTLRRSGALAAHMQGETPPYVVGMEAAGVVDEIGPDTSTPLHIGDEVTAIVVPSGSSGAYAEYVVVPADSVVGCPKGSTFVEAATLPMNGLTARAALDALALDPGAHLGVTGAAGSVGGYALQIATAEGLHVIADASRSDHELVAALGASVIVPRGGDVAQHIRSVVPEGVDGLVDAALLRERALPAVRDGGRMALVRPGELESERDIDVLVVSVRAYATRRDKLAELRQHVEDGVITLRVATTVPATRAAAAHRMLEAGGTRGRIVLEL